MASNSGQSQQAKVENPLWRTNCGSSNCDAAQIQGGLKRTPVSNQRRGNLSVFALAHGERPVTRLVLKSGTT